MINLEKTFFDDIDMLLDATIEGILITKDGFIVNANQSFIDIIGYENKSKVIGNLATGCLMPSAKETYIEHNKNTFQEISLISKEGSFIPAMMQIKDIIIKDIEFKIISIIDLTEMKEKESLLLKQSRLAAMGEMISMIAHQWRQPLMAISVAVTNLKMKLSMKKVDIDFFETKLDEVNQYLQYTSETINDFKDFFKNDKPKQRFFLNKLVQSGVNMIVPSFKMHGITINIADTKLGELYLQQNELLQVFLNIINNAKDAFIENKTEHPRIDISFLETATTQEVYIQDNAGGIPAHIIDRIFEPYFSTKDELNGTGLGLYMCKIIVERQCNGKILVENTKEGCCFKIILNKS